MRANISEAISPIWYTQIYYQREQSKDNKGKYIISGHAHGVQTNCYQRIEDYQCSLEFNYCSVSIICSYMLYCIKNKTPFYCLCLPSRDLSIWYISGKFNVIAFPCYRFQVSELNRSTIQCSFICWFFFLFLCFTKKGKEERPKWLTR